VPPFLPKRFLFQEDVQELLHQPVAFDLMTARQIRVHLASGRMQFAMLSPADYAEIAPASVAEVLAVPTNAHGQTSRQGLIVVAPNSRLHSVAELKGIRFHFMPSGDVLNEAALGALLDAGVEPDNIDKGILGLELDTSHISSLEVAKSVVLEDNAAGVIDEADYQAWPETGGSLVLLSPSKAQVRVIGKTVRVPEGPFVASLAAPSDLRSKLRNYLLDDINNKKLVLGVLGVNGFTKPVAAEEYKDYAEVHRKLQARKNPQAPAETQESE
jgi:ABC-type phosphate/phosphonate transport system substrate-binding protein